MFLLCFVLVSFCQPDLFPEPDRTVTACAAGVGETAGLLEDEQNYDTGSFLPSSWHWRSGSAGLRSMRCLASEPSPELIPYCPGSNNMKWMFSLDYTHQKSSPVNPRPSFHLREATTYLPHSTLMELVHSSLGTGHPRIQQTLLLLQLMQWWPPYVPEISLCAGLS